MNANQSSNVIPIGSPRNWGSGVAIHGFGGAVNSLSQLAPPRWNETVRQRIEKLLRLSPGWDNADARPVDVETARYALGLLQYIWFPDGPAPFVAPTCYGGLQFEWSVLGFDFEIEVVRSRQIRVLLVDSEDESEAAFECRHDLTELSVAVDKFQQRYERSLRETAAA